MGKIDISIINSARTQDSSEINCLVFYKNYSTLNRLKNNKDLKINENYPHFRVVNISGNISKILSLARYEDIEYISRVCIVNCLMDRARTISGVDNIITYNHNFTVAVIDTGVDIGLDLSVPFSRVIKFVDLVNGKETPYDDNGHGTFVTNVLCGSGVVSNFRYKGVDPNCRVISIKALNSEGEGDANNILRAMQWVLDNKKKYNIRAVCMSFGATPTNPKDPLAIGAEVLWDNGITVICAVGNSGPKESSIMSPAISRKIISVGAIDDGRNSSHVVVPDFSSRGPVNNIIKPDVVASGVGVVAAGSFHLSHKHYTSMSGTSVATPIIAGVVSRLISNNSSLTPIQIKHIILNNTRKISYDLNSEGNGYIYFG